MLVHNSWRCKLLTTGNLVLCLCPYTSRFKIMSSLLVSSIRTQDLSTFAPSQGSARQCWLHGAIWSLQTKCDRSTEGDIEAGEWNLNNTKTEIINTFCFVLLIRHLQLHAMIKSGVCLNGLDACYEQVCKTNIEVSQHVSDFTHLPFVRTRVRW